MIGMGQFIAGSMQELLLDSMAPVSPAGIGLVEVGDIVDEKVGKMDPKLEQDLSTVYVLCHFIRETKKLSDES